MKYIKKNSQVIEPEINEEGYYVVGNVAIHSDVFHRDYQSLGFILTPEEVEELKEFLEEEIQALDLSVQFLMTTEDFESCKHNSEAIEKRNKWLNRIKQYQDEKYNQDK